MALDQDIVNLAKAVRQVESGNNPVQGASGELKSRYQFMPDTWKSNAKRILGDENAPLTLQNENRVAYTMMKELKDKGYKANQIAAAWNAGEGKLANDAWKTNVGVNSAGVKYDTPGYVSKVGKAYQQIKGSATPTSTPQAPTMPTISPEQQADTEAKQRFGAFLAPNTQDPSLVAEPLKTVANIPKSAFGFAKGLLQQFNPLEIVENIKRAGEEFKGLREEAGGTSEALKLAFGAVPGAAYQSFVPEAAQGAIEATGAKMRGDEAGIDVGLQKAQRALVSDPVGQILPILMAGRAGAGALERGGVVPKGTGAALDTAVTKTARPFIEPVKRAVTGAAEKTAGATRFGVGQATGLQPETITEIQRQPRAFTREKIKAGPQRENIGKQVQSVLEKRKSEVQETGKVYQPIRESGAQVKLQPDWLESQIKSKAGVDIVNGKVKATTTSKTRNASDIRALQSLYDNWNPSFKKGLVTADEYLNFRSDLSGLSKFERQVGKSQPVENIAKGIREDFNKGHRKQVPGLSELDAKFSAELNELKRLSKGLVDKSGELRPTAFDTIANATGKTFKKGELLGRLEEMVPGITDQLKSAKAIQDIQNASGIKVGTYARGAALGGSLLLGGPIQAIITAILTSPEIAVPLLRSTGLIKNAAVVRAVMQALRESGSKVNRLPEAPILQEDVIGGGTTAFGPKGKGIKNVSSQLDDLYKKAPAAKKEIDLVIDNLAKDIDGAYTIKAPIKGKERALEKIMNDYAGDVTQISDLARNTLAVPKGVNFQKIIDKIDNVVKSKVINVGDDPLGYIGANIKYKTKGGMVAEIQINTPEMLYAKDGNIAILGEKKFNEIKQKTGLEAGMGHKYYEQLRKPGLSDDAKIAMIEESRRYYENFY